MVISLEEMKSYLRVDFDDDDALIEGLILSSEQLCMDISRISDKKKFEKEPCAKVAVMYAVAVQYENRNDTNPMQLAISIRALLLGIRQEEF